MSEGTTGQADERPKADLPGAEAASAVEERGEVESLRNRLKDAEQERDDYRALLLRSRAEFENYQKRIQRDLTEERRYANAGLARELLPVLDNLQRALDAVGKEPGNEALLEGVGLVQKHLHEAVSQEPREDVPPGTVVRVREPGYQLHERVLRPARVVVAAPPANG